MLDATAVELAMSLTADLRAAEADLTDILAELPNVEALVSENEAEAQRLRGEKADLTEQVAARGRVVVARELLEEHRADLAATQTRIGELRAQLQVEGDRRRLVKLEKELLAARGPWAERAIAASNHFFETAAELRLERLEAQAKEDKAARLRRSLKERGADAPEQPEGLRHYPPRSWSLGTFADPAKNTLLVPQFDRVLNGSGIFQRTEPKGTVVQDTTTTEATAPPRRDDGETDIRDFSPNQKTVREPLEQVDEAADDD